MSRELLPLAQELGTVLFLYKGTDRELRTGSKSGTFGDTAFRRDFERMGVFVLEEVDSLMGGGRC